MKLSESERAVLPRNLVLINDMHAAMDRGDMDEYYRLVRELEPCAEALLATKEAFGAEMVRELGLNTSAADAEYGTGWLDE